MEPLRKISQPASSTACSIPHSTRPRLCICLKRHSLLTPKISARGCATSGKDDKASDPDAGNKQPLIAGQEGMDCTGSI